ncbi:MAG: hypothetical protein QOH34_4168 [Mycobacterium sp.]|jgi:hypothetical protein|nr:hypothetical protein [Mycobacterium sp.]
MAIEKRNAAPFIGGGDCAEFSRRSQAREPISLRRSVREIR